MDIEELENHINSIKQNIANVEELISDYKNCQSSISKKILEAAIAKYSASLNFAKDEQ